jgi:hypothetical protein
MLSMSLAQDTPLADVARDWRVFRHLPELADSPTTFRVALRIIAANWTQGSITVRVAIRPRTLHRRGASRGRPPD